MSEQQIRRCIECGRPLKPDQEAFDRTECEELNKKKLKEITQQKKKLKTGLTKTNIMESTKLNSRSIFWLRGEGSNRREHNIEIVKDMVREGYKFDEICKLARKVFRPATISEYYDIASEEIEEELLSQNYDIKQKEVKENVK